MSIFQRRALIKHTSSSTSTTESISSYHQNILNLHDDEWFAHKEVDCLSPMQYDSDEVNRQYLRRSPHRLLIPLSHSFCDLFSIHLLSFLIQEFLPIADLKRLYSTLPQAHRVEYCVPARMTILKWYHLFGEHKVLREDVPRSHSSRHLDRIHKYDLVDLKQRKQSHRVKLVAKLFFCLLGADPLVRQVRRPARTIDNFHCLKLSLSEETQFFLYPLELWADVSKVRLGEIKIGILLEIRDQLKDVIGEPLRHDSYLAHAMACSLRELIEWSLHPVVRSYCILDADVQKYSPWVREMKEQQR